MADKYSGWSCTHSTSVVAETNTTKTIRVTCYWTNSGWNYDIGGVSAWVYCAGSEHQVKSNGAGYFPSNHASYDQGSYDFVIDKGTSAKSVSCYAKITSTSSYVSGTKSSSVTSVSVAAKPSYTVSYNANGGIGAPGNQTKWYDTNLTLSSVKPTKTGHSFKIWNKNNPTSGVSFSPGSVYSTNANLALYAVWTPDSYLVKYNANGGSGAPTNQTKTYGVNLTLSSAIPTRKDYNFLGWSTSANGGVVYKPGSTYTNNSEITLYAVWELAYMKPRITNFNAQRCTADGTNDESGTYIKYTFDWATDYEVVAIWVYWSTKSDLSNYLNSEVKTSGTSGSVTKIAGDGAVDNETTYYVRVYVEDGGGSSHSTILSISTVKYPIDVKKGGTGVAIGKVAEHDKLLDIGWDTDITGKITIGIENIRQLVMGSSTEYSWIDSRDDSGVYKNNIVLYDDYTFTPIMKAHNLLVDRGLASDLNAIIDTTGIYAYDNNTKNIPTNFAQWGSVINYKIYGWCYQIAFGNYQMDKESQMLAVRTYVNDKWVNWHYVDGREKVLYENKEGSTGTITLSESAANFNYLEIYYLSISDTNTGYSQNSTRVCNPDGKSAWLSTGYCCSDDYNIKLCAALISDTQITKPYGYWEFKDTSSSPTNYIGITKVIGYK